MALMKRVLLGRPLSSAEQQHQRLAKLIGSRSSRRTRSLRPRTRRRRSSSSPPSARRASRSVSTSSSRSRSSSCCCWPSLSRRTGGRSTRTRAAAASYVVSRENLGDLPSLVAGASILVDYILTVAVSVSAGVAAIISIPRARCCGPASCRWSPRVHRGDHAANLRGIKESGRLFAVPTYFYIVMLVLLIVRADQSFFGGRQLDQVPFDPSRPKCARSRRHARPVPDPEGLLVGRGRAHRRRGDLRRRPRVPQPAAKNAAITLR